jgi:hypothetical protein
MTPEPTITRAEPPVPVTPGAPDIPPLPQPEPEPVQELGPAPVPAEPAQPPLTLVNSDPEVRTDLKLTSPPALYSQALEQGNLIERAADLVAGGHKGYLVDRAIPLPAPQGKFQVRKEGELLLVDPANYNRYDPYVEVAEAVDTEALVAAFHRFRPLLEQAYGTLGYPPGDFDNALLATLDLVLATPRLEAPAALKLDITTYEYADPALEALPGLQKQLMRMGPDNLARLQAVAARWRAALLRP